MSFIDIVKNVRQLSVIDEFGGRGSAGKIKKFYIVFRVTDESGSEIEVGKMDVESAVLNNNLVISDYMGNAEYTLSVLNNNPKNTHFIVSKVEYKFNSNIITVDVREFKGNASISVKFKRGSEVIASTCYLSDSPSCFFLSKKQ